MSRKSLKSIIGKRKEAGGLLQLLMASWGKTIRVEDVDGGWLFGSEDSPAGAERLPVVLDGETLGWVLGEAETAPAVASLLEYLLAKESEKKKLGAEVLNLYREINVIYNFSAKLAEVIDPAVIAAIALEEANHVIQAAAGLVVLREETSGALQIIARNGRPDLFPEGLSASGLILPAFGPGEQAEIINQFAEDPRSRGANPSIEALLYTPLKVSQSVMGAILLASDAPVQYTAADLKLLTTLALQSASAIESARLYERTIREAHEREETLRTINAATSRFVPYELIHILGRNSIVDVQLGDQVEREVTVMFTDIRGYTTLAESMTPEENFRFLNAFIGRIGPVISEHRGFIIRFLGDGVMSLFLHTAEDALRAAIGIQGAIVRYNEQRLARGWQPIRAGIGLHKGPLIMGIMGNQQRMEANLVSDTVNVASRMEGLTKYFGAHLIVSNRVLREIDDPGRFRHRFLGDVQVKGKNQATGIYDIYEADPPDVLAKKRQTHDMFERGMRAYFSRAFEDATSAFAQVLTVHPEDKAAQIYLSNAVRYYSDGVHDNWSAVEKLEIK